MTANVCNKTESSAEHSVNLGWGDIKLLCKAANASERTVRAVLNMGQLSTLKHVKILRMAQFLTTRRAQLEEQFEKEAMEESRMYDERSKALYTGTPQTDY